MSSRNIDPDRAVRFGPGIPHRHRHRDRHRSKPTTGASTTRRGAGSDARPRHRPRRSRGRSGAGRTRHASRGGNAAPRRASASWASERHRRTSSGGVRDPILREPELPFERRSGIALARRSPRSRVGADRPSIARPSVPTERIAITAATRTRSPDDASLLGPPARGPCNARPVQKRQPTRHAATPKRRYVLVNLRSRQSSLQVAGSGGTRSCWRGERLAVVPHPRARCGLVCVPSFSAS